VDHLDVSGVEDWDAPHNTIFCNGMPFRIRQNIYDVLYQLSTMNNAESPYLWADLLCINQSDIQDRGGQVSLINEIYSSASCVICWLGRGDEHLNRFVKLHKILAPAICAHTHDESIEKSARYDVEDRRLMSRARLACESRFEPSMPPPSLNNRQSYSISAKGSRIRIS
jgi:hypothetical protein